MFKRIMFRFRDIKTVSKLISGADQQAHINGKEEPGAEHFVLSALNLEDGTAKRVFERLGMDDKKFRGAIKIQYQDALKSVGISQKAIETDPKAITSERIFRDSQPSGKDLMKSLYSLKKEDKDQPLLSAHVLIVAANIEHGIVPRVLRVLGIDRELLVKVATEELELVRC